jgi:hypothetical protein
MPEPRTPTDVENWFTTRMQEIAQRERGAWDEYLGTIRGLAAEVYDQSEALAWRRLRRTMAQLSHDRRRDEFERDRAIAEIRGLRLAG